jgi:hypothetical protein
VPTTRRSASALARVSALGAAGGFVLGSLILGLLQHNSPGGWSWVDVPFSMMFGGTFGALVGAVGAPVTGWLFFRHVPLGRAMIVTGAGTMAGAAIGLAVAGSPLIGGCVGFLAAAVLLRFSRAA